MFDDAVAQIEEETNMTYVTSVERVRLKREREAGRQEGREEGREEGRLSGAAQSLENQIMRKFGALPDWARVRIDEANETALNRWTLQILDAQRIEDVFA